MDILNYHADKTVFMPEDTIEYACWEGYQPANNMPTGTTRCGINGEWNPEPQCLGEYCCACVILYIFCEAFFLKIIFCLFCSNQ